jgi:hypothetical protein
MSFFFVAKHSTIKDAHTLYHSWSLDNKLSARIRNNIFIVVMYMIAVLPLALEIQGTSQI